MSSKTTNIHSADAVFSKGLVSLHMRLNETQDLCQILR